MATLKGPGAMTQVELLGTIKLPKDSGIKPGVHKMTAKAAQSELMNADKAMLMTVQVNNIGKSPEQADTNPYLVSERVERKDGKPGYNHAIFYDNTAKENGKQSQVQQILEQCDSYSVDENGYATFAFKADVGQRGNGKNGCFVKTDTVQKSDQKVTPTLSKDQFMSTRAAQKYAAEQRSNEKGALASEMEAKAEQLDSKGAEAAMDEPQA